MKTLATAAVAVTMLSGILTGQQPQTTFRARVDRVRIDAMVVEKGRPVTGLTAADFDVRDNGRAVNEAGKSSLSGLTSTNSAPRAWAASSDGRTMCRPGPPPPTIEFLIAIPPNATISSVCSTMLGQVTPDRERIMGAKTRGKMTLDAPAL